VELLVSMYADCLNIAPSMLRDDERDFILLSKGHAVPALYGLLAELDYFPAERLAAHLCEGGDIYWHPNPTIPGVEFRSGSLGHLLSVGIGIALDARLRRTESKVAVVVGDGELDEGSIWEGVLVARAHELSRLVLVVDRNGIQANTPTEDLVPLEPLVDKFEAFGWKVHNVDGHSFTELRQAFAQLSPRRPTAIIANTVRGKGISEHEGRVDRWFVRASQQDADAWRAAITRTAAVPSGRRN
jgi:transketolase